MLELQCTDETIAGPEGYLRLDIAIEDELVILSLIPSLASQNISGPSDVGPMPRLNDLDYTREREASYMHYQVCIAYRTSHCLAKAENGTVEGGDP